LDETGQVTATQTQACLSKLGSPEVKIDLFVDYMLCETLKSERGAEEQKKCLARLLGILSGPKKGSAKGAGLEPSWKETIMRIQAVASPAFIRKHGLHVTADQLMIELPEESALALYGAFIASYTPAQRTLFDFLSSDFLEANYKDPVAMNLKLLQTIVAVQCAIRKFVAKCKMLELRREREANSFKFRICPPAVSSTGVERKIGCSTDKCSIC